MQSKMTEREFRGRLRSEVGCGEDSITANGVVDCAREAGLEFAPEPLPVAPVLGDLNGWATFSGFHAWERFPQGNSPFDVSETYALGIARYNAYPGLRLAVEREIEQILHHHTLQHPYRTDALVLIADRLRAELAKGPK